MHLRLRGQLVDSQGRPVDGMHVYVMDGTPLNGSYWSFEHARESRRPDDPLVTGPRGIFTIPQVLDRPYHLRFIDPETLLMHDAEAMDPSSGPVRVTLPANPTVAELKGVVLDAFAQPVPGARIRLSARTWVNPNGNGWNSLVRDVATTDDRGAFTLRNTPWEGLTLGVKARDTPNDQYTDFELTQELIQGPLDLRLDLECAIEIRIIQALEVDALEFQTDSGEALTATAYGPGMRNIDRRFEIGPSGEFFPGSVSQRATQVILFHEDKEVGRQPIRLEAAKPNAPNTPNVIEL